MRAVNAKVTLELAAGGDQHAAAASEVLHVRILRLRFLNTVIIIARLATSRLLLPRLLQSTKHRT